MRADVLAALFLTRRFHVVYSPYMGSCTQPAATQYMNKYGSLMASVTLEVDFTKLAGSWRPEAVRLDGLRGLNSVKRLVETFVQNQLNRRNNNPIRDLRVLVKRYHGFRPNPLSALPSSSSSSPSSSSSSSSSSSPSPLFSYRSTSHVSTPGSSSITSTIRSHLHLPRSGTTPPAAMTTRRDEYTPAAHVRHALAALLFLAPVVWRLTLSGAPADFAAELAAEWPRCAARAPSGRMRWVVGEGASKSSPPLVLLFRAGEIVKWGWGDGGGRRSRRKKRKSLNTGGKTKRLVLGRPPDELGGTLVSRRRVSGRKGMDEEEISSSTPRLGQNGASGGLESG
ncbi:hypothetical protein VTH82DRAFT_6303 [Thermothelomyces myriococcoides]